MVKKNKIDNVYAKNFAGGNQVINYNNSNHKKYCILKDKLNRLNIFDLCEKIYQIDNNALNIMREVEPEGINESTINEIYKSYIVTQAGNFKINPHRLLNILNNSDLKLNDEIKHDMTMKIADDLTWLKIETNNYNVVSIDDPKLIWECHKSISDSYDYKNCTIHKNFNTKEEADDFTKIFQEGNVKIIYNDIPITWKQYPTLWPPSIDALYLMKNMMENGYTNEFFNEVIDIGAGTGILGLWIAKNNQHVKNVTFTDWLLTPLIISYLNSKAITLNCSTKFMLGLNTAFINDRDSSKVYDLAICNPPYLPHLGIKKLLRESTVAGTELLTHIIINHKQIAKKVVISFSNIALPEALEAARKIGIDLESMKLPNSEYCVPFRVKVAFKEEKYINKLQKERDLIVDNNAKFKYWHKINTYILE